MACHRFKEVLAGLQVALLKVHLCAVGQCPSRSHYICVLPEERGHGLLIHCVAACCAGDMGC
jgi:hypothetical protein